MCPQGYGDFQCETSLYKKCMVNFTEPALHKGCPERPDTPYYLYSVPGYDPCHFFNFSRSYKMKYLIECRSIDEMGQVTTQADQARANLADGASGNM